MRVKKNGIFNLLMLTFLIVMTAVMLLSSDALAADTETTAVLSDNGYFTPTGTNVDQDKGTYRIDYNLDSDGIKYMTVLVTLKRGGANVNSATYTMDDKLTFKRINKSNYVKSKDYASRYALLTGMTMYKSDNLYAAMVDQAQASYLFLINYRGDSGNYSDRIVFGSSNHKKGDYEISGSNLDMALTNNGNRIYTYAYSVDYFNKTYGTTSYIKNQYSNKTVSMTTSVSKPKDGNGNEITISGINLHTTGSLEIFEGGHDKKSGYQTDKITSNIQFYKSNVDLNMKFTLVFKASYKEKSVTKNPACYLAYEGVGIYTNLFGLTYQIKLLGDKNLSKDVHTTKTRYDNDNCENNRYLVTFCTKCHEELSKEKAFKSHDYEITKTDKEATCTEKGQQTVVCRDCGYCTKQDIPAKGHSYVETDYYIDTTNFTVSEYFNSVRPTTIQASAECKNNYHVKVCKNCYYLAESRAITPKPHKYDNGNITKTATCTGEGEKEYRCTVCSVVKKEKIPALGHNYTDWSVEKKPDCILDGYEVRTCTRCNLGRETRTLKALGHECEEYIKEAPTCTRTGTIYKKCKRKGCNYDQYVRTTEALGHNDDNNYITETEPTCTTNGTAWSHCSRCNIKMRPKSVPALGHDYTKLKSKETVKKPTCTEGGYYKCTYGCSRCSSDATYFTYKRGDDALGHKYETKLVKKPDCKTNTNGVNETRCTRCNSLKKTEYVKPEHTYDDGRIEKDPTHDEPGLKIYTCKICGYEKREKIPAEKDRTTEKPTEKTTEKTKDKNTEKPSEGKNVKDGVGKISEDGKILTDESGVKYNVAEKLTEKQLKTNLKIADKKSGGKYKIIKIKKNKKGKVIGGSLIYVAPYNKKCTLISATNKVKLGGVTFNVTIIGKNCAKGCKNLRKVVIGSKVTTIGANAFCGCSKLSTVRITSKSIKKIGKNAFKGTSSKAKVTIPKSKLSNYRTKLKKAGLSSGAVLMSK